jgi:NitT/TauT family transport system substrate-binding protein
MLKGTEVLGGRAGGMPQMVFEYILKMNGIDPKVDLTIDQSIDFGSTAAAFSGGQGDYTVEFEPHATALEIKGDGYVVASLGVDSGYVPYTAFSAKKSYLEENPEVVQGFVNSIQKGMDYVNNHTPEEIAQIIAPQFPETDMVTLTQIITRYYEQDTWKEDLIFTEDAFVLLINILRESGVLDAQVPYEDLVNTDFANKAANK